MDNKLIGNRINELLAKNNMLQKELAKQLNVSDNVISYWCCGSRKPSIEQIIQIANIFNCSTDYLLGVSDVATSDKDLQYICDYVGLSEEVVNKLHSLSANTTLEYDEDDFSYQYENLSDVEIEKLENNELDKSEAYQKYRLSEILSELLKYFTDNSKIIFQTITFVNEAEFDSSTHKKVSKHKEEINANLYELVTKYIATLHDTLGVNDIK